MSIARAELVFVRTCCFWRFWAFGYHCQPTRSGHYEIVTVAFGPMRWQFLNWGKRWRFQCEVRTRL